MGVFSDDEVGSGVTKTTVRLGAASATLTIPVLNAEAPSRIRATARLFVVSGSGPVVTVTINGSTSNVVMQELNAVGPGTALATQGGRIAVLGNSGAHMMLEITGHVGKAVGKRSFTVTATSSTGVGQVTIWTASVVYNDSATTITSIEIVGNQANCFGAGSEARIEEEVI